MRWFKKLFGLGQDPAAAAVLDAPVAAPTAPAPSAKIAGEASPPSAVPDGTWVWIWIHAERLLAFTYLDRTAGPSAKGGLVPPGEAADDVAAAIERPNRTVRLHPNAWRMEPVTAGDLRRLALPAEPSWLVFYGGSQPWRRDPRLAGRFHPECPDDLQVLVHDGGSKTSPHPPELIWATVVESDGPDYVAVALNQPHRLRSVVKGGRFTFRATGSMPLLVSEAYRAEREEWTIEPCSSCGVGELLDPPSRLAALSFGAAEGVAPVAFTQRCPLCAGGVLMVKRAGETV